MNCREIKKVMHEALDMPEDVAGKNLRQIELHCRNCPECAGFWAGISKIEAGLAEFEQVNVPIDFSSLDWHSLAGRETVAENYQESLSVKLKLPVVLLGVLGVLLLGIWSIPILGFWLRALEPVWQSPFDLISTGRLIRAGALLMKQVLYWSILLGALWQGILTFVVANISYILSTVTVACFSLYYLLKTRRRAILKYE